jgi:ribosomal protein L20
VVERTQSRETNPSCCSCFSARGRAAFVSSLALHFRALSRRATGEKNHASSQTWNQTPRPAQKAAEARQGIFPYQGQAVPLGERRDYRALWIQRIGAAARNNGTTYSQLIHALKAGGIDLDRKILADMAVHDADGFASLVGSVKQHFPKPGVVQTARPAVVRHHEEG